MKKKIILNIYIVALISLLFVACKKYKTAPEVTTGEKEVVNEEVSEQKKLLIGVWGLFSKKETSVVDGNIVSSETHDGQTHNFKFAVNNEVTIISQGSEETKEYKLLADNKILIGGKLATIEFIALNQYIKLCVITTRTGDNNTYVEVKLMLSKLY